MPTRRETTTWVRRIGALFVALLVMAACGSGDTDVPASGQAAEAATTTDRPHVVEPRVLCVEDGLAFLTYTNHGDTSVDYPVGPANTLGGGDGETSDIGSSEAQATVFAPGEQDLVAAWVPIGWTWTLGSGDDQRSVVADGEPCGGWPLPQDPPDTRVGSLEGEADFTVDGDGLVDSAIVTLTYEGLGESRCPSGPATWTPQPVEVVLDAGSTVTDDGDEIELRNTDRRDGVLTVPIAEPRRAPGAAEPVGFKKFFVNVDATDVCVGDDGTEHRSWVASEDLVQIGLGDQHICFGIVETDEGETYAEVDCSLAPTLPLTDGIRIRIP